MLTKHISNRLFITNSDPYLVVSVGFCPGFTLRSQGARLGWIS
jgi:allophanate hydrolase subunit 1